MFRKIVFYGRIIFLLFATIITFNSCSKKNNLYTIGIIQVVDNVVLNDARNAVMESLKEAGFEEGKNLNVIYKNAQGEISNIAMILQSFNAEDVDMVITLGTPCMAGAAQFIKNKPAVFTVAFSPEQIGIVNPPKTLTGVYDPMDVKELLDVIKTINPTLKKVGIIYNTSEANAQYGAEKMRKACINQNLELVEATINSSSEVLQAATSLAQKKVEAFTVVADNIAYVGLEAIVKVSLQNKIPLYVSDPSHVIRGALAGKGGNYTEWGRKSGRIAARIIKGEDARNIPIEVLDQQDFVINKKIALQLGITIPEELVKVATRVIE
jgi:putative ABC transport system substrate-binding protein